MRLPLNKKYRSEVYTDIVKQQREENKFWITAASIAHLPKAVIGHFSQCGFIGKHKAVNVALHWKDVWMQMSFKGRPVKLSCCQYNAAPEPTRIVYMSSKIAGFIPFEGRDKFQDGHGNMLIKLAGIFTVADDSGPVMDKAALVTLLAETFLLPAYALQPYIRWQALDDHTAHAAISFNGIEAGGTFYFNEGGQFYKFETTDRYNTDQKRNIPWSVRCGDYKPFDGVLLPTDLKAVWHYPEGDLVYFKGSISRVVFDVDKAHYLD